MLLRLRKSGGWNENKQIYEMNFGNDKWYFIHRDRMQLQGPTGLQRNLFNALILGLVAVVKASYSRAKRKLRLEL